MDTQPPSSPLNLGSEAAALLRRSRERTFSRMLTRNAAAQALPGGVATRFLKDMLAGMFPPGPLRLMKTLVRALRGVTLVLLFVLTFGTLRGQGISSPSSNAPGALASTAISNFGRLPLQFIENRGQMDSQVRYYSHGDNGIYFTSQGVTLAILETDTNAPMKHHLKRGLHLPDPKEKQRQRWALKLDFVGADPQVQPVAQDSLPGVVSYFKGPREQWKTGLRTYAKLLYTNLWPGIDLEYSGKEGHLKYTFVVKSGADPQQIRMSYRGATAIGTNAAGHMEVSTPIGNIRDDKPIAYQDIAGQRIPVAVSYAMDSSVAPRGPGTDTAGSYHFAVGAYDPHYALIIDPAVFVYQTLLGDFDNSFERGLGLTVDVAGNAYVCGEVISPFGPSSFPVAAGPDLTFNGGLFDAFVLKLAADGKTLLYSGFIGGDGQDGAFAVAIDPSGAAYVCGFSQSSEQTFPVTGGPDLHYHGGTYDLDAFVAKVAPTGTNLEYCGYVAGAGAEAAENIAVDASGNAYLTGYTTSDEHSFPVVVGPDLTYNGGDVYGWDTFVAKVKANPTNSVVKDNFAYCGYIGGSGEDAGAFNGFVTGGSIAIDTSGSAYVCSFTASHEDTFPNGQGFASLSIPGFKQTYNGGAFDAFLAKVKADGSGLAYCTYLGGSGLDGAFGVGVDGMGNAYICGITSSSETNNFPVRGGPDLHFHGGTGHGGLGVGLDGFVAKVNAGGTDLAYCGYIGGTADDDASMMRVDANGTCYITGWTESTNFPVVGGPSLYNNYGSFDGFVAKVKPNPTDANVRSNYEFCGYMGSISFDAAFDISFDSVGNAYVCGDYFDNRGAFVVKVASGTAVSNDDFDGSKVITSLPYTDEAATFFATRADDDPDGIETNYLGSLVTNRLYQTSWYSFTPSSDTLVRVTLLNPYGPQPFVFKGDRGALSPIPSLGGGCKTFFPPDTEIVIRTFSLLAGVTYHIVIAYSPSFSSPAYGSKPVTFDIRVPTPPPPNDDFNAATVISSLPFRDTPDISGATRALDDPTIANNTVWYAFTPSRNFRIGADTFGSSNATILAAFTGTRGSLSSVAFSPICHTGSQVLFDVRAGVTYYFLLGTFDCYDNGPKVFSMKEVTAPQNDDFDHPRIIPSLPFVDNLDTIGASRAADDPYVDCVYGGSGFANATVWYSITAPRTMLISASTEGSDYDTLVAFYQGTRGSLFSVACNDDICDKQFWQYCPNCSALNVRSRVIFLAQAGVTYYLMAGGVSVCPPFGGRLSLSVTEVPLDLRIDPIALRNLDGRITVTGTATCARPGTGFINTVWIVQPPDCQPIFHKSGKVTFACNFAASDFSGAVPFQCDGQTHPWSMTTTEGIIGAGPATVFVASTLSEADSCNTFSFGFCLFSDPCPTTSAPVFIRPTVSR